MSAPHLNISGLNLTPPVSLAATAVATTATTAVAGASSSVLSRIPAWGWVLLILTLVVAIYYFRQRSARREAKIDRALEGTAQNKQRLDENEENDPRWVRWSRSA